MAATGLDAVDAACDLLIAEDLRPNQVTPGPAHGSLGPFLAHPVSMVGTDSTFVGAKPSPRTWGSFPRILGEFVRDQRLMPLETAVRKMTSAPAARLGIPDRGILRDGMRADIVVFDPALIRSTATYEAAAVVPGRACRTWWSTARWSSTAGSTRAPCRAARSGAADPT